MKYVIVVRRREHISHRLIAIHLVYLWGERYMTKVINLDGMRWQTDDRYSNSFKNITIKHGVQNQKASARSG